MRRSPMNAAAVLMSAMLGWYPSAADAQAPVQKIDLAERLTAGKLRAVNRDAPAPGSGRGIHVGEKAGPGVIWIEGTDFSEGTIELEVRGRDVPQQSFVGVAFHGKDDNTYEGVYLRPFNFRNQDAARRENAVQYISVPDYDWPRLRKEFPGEFENPVDPSVAPTEWVPLRIVVSSKNVQVYAGAVTSPTLDVRRLGTLERGLIGLWVGNNSGGDFANLRITPAK